MFSEPFSGLSFRVRKRSRFSGRGLVFGATMWSRSWGQKVISFLEPDPGIFLGQKVVSFSGSRIAQILR